MNVVFWVRPFQNKRHGLARPSAIDRDRQSKVISRGKGVCKRSPLHPKMNKGATRKKSTGEAGLEILRNDRDKGRKGGINVTWKR